MKNSVIEDKKIIKQMSGEYRKIDGIKGLILSINAVVKLVNLLTLNSHFYKESC